MGSLLVETADDGIATLTIQREAVGNAIDLTVIRALHAALDQIQRADSRVRALVLTGGGSVFCSGLDLRSVDLGSQQARQRAHLEMRRFMDPLILRLTAFRYPIIAAVNGAAVGAGMSLALACDIVIVAENAYFCPSFCRLGLVPDAGITYTLARRVGAGRSLASLLLAEKIDSARAYEWGLAYAIAANAQVLEHARGVARKLAAGPAGVIAQIRALHAATFDHSLEQQLRAERSAQEMSLATPDCVEGVRAFFEKRAPQFTEI
jgi:2-(1,2-epoxy-1,2-dihydrophenyl)acetyl-CoA isomerase